MPRSRSRRASRSRGAERTALRRYPRRRSSSRARREARANCESAVPNNLALSAKDATSGSARSRTARRPAHRTRDAEGPGARDARRSAPPVSPLRRARSRAARAYPRGATVRRATEPRDRVPRATVRPAGGASISQPHMRRDRGSSSAQAPRRRRTPNPRARCSSTNSRRLSGAPQDTHPAKLAQCRRLGEDSRHCAVPRRRPRLGTPPQPG